MTKTTIKDRWKIDLNNISAYPQNEVKFYKRSNLEDEDDDEIFGSGEFLGYMEKNKKLTYIEIALDEPIKGPKYYRPIIQKLHSLGEGDKVVITIDTYGGSADGILALCEALASTEADVEAVITGMAASAGSIIAMKVPSISIAPSARMMIHSACYGTYGKQSDIRSFVQFHDNWLNEVFKETYAGFLSEEEMLQCLDGKEFWMLAPEIERRFLQREEFFQDREKEANRIALESQKSPVSKRKAKSKN